MGSDSGRPAVCKLGRANGRPGDGTKTVKIENFFAKLKRRNVYKVAVASFGTDPGSVFTTSGNTARVSHFGGADGTWDPAGGIKYQFALDGISAVPEPATWTA